MPWVRTDDAAPLHPKLFRAGVAAAGYWWACLSYCNRYLTNGFIPARDLDLVFPGTPHEQVMDLIEILVRERLLDTREDGYQMHDYLHYQPARRDVLRQRRDLTTARRAAGRQGGVKSGVSRRNGHEAKSKQDHEASSKQTLEPKRSPVLTRPVPSLPVPSLPVPENNNSKSIAPTFRSTRARRQPTDREPGVRQVLDAYHSAFVEAHGEKPNITGKDAALARQLVQRHGVDKVLAVQAAMFASRDPFIAAHHALGTLSSQWNTLVATPRSLSRRLWEEGSREDA